MGNHILAGVIRSLHDIFSIIWIGSLFFLSFVVIPVVKRKFDKENEIKIMDNIFDRLSYFIFVSIIFLVITGILEHRFAKYSYLKIGKTLPSAYVVIHKIKYVLTGIMVIVVIIRQIMRQKMKKQLINLRKFSENKGMSNNDKSTSIMNKKMRPYILVYLNTIIGMVVVILSGILSTVR